MTAVQPVFYRDLLPSERRLVTAMHRFRFGRFLRLEIQRGEAVLSPWPATVCAVKFGDKLTDQTRSFSNDAKLPQQVCELVGYIRRIGTGEILLLEFRHALPFRMEVAVAKISGDSAETRAEAEGIINEK